MGHFCLSDIVKYNYIVNFSLEGAANIPHLYLIGIPNYYMSEGNEGIYCYTLELSFSSDPAQNFFAHVLDP